MYIQEARTLVDKQNQGKDSYKEEKLALKYLCASGMWYRGWRVSTIWPAKISGKTDIFQFLEGMGSRTKRKSGGT